MSHFGYISIWQDISDETRRLDIVHVRQGEGRHVDAVRRLRHVASLLWSVLHDCADPLFVCLLRGSLPGLRPRQREGVTLDWVFSCPDLMANI